MANENLSGAPKENGEELSQASGNSATWESIIHGQPTPASSSDHVTRASSLNEESDNFFTPEIEPEPFYFDPEAEDISENFMKDPTDFTDVALVAKRKRIAKILGSAALVLAVLIGGGYFGMKTFMSSQETQQKSADESVTASPEEQSISPTEVAKPKNPLKDLAASAPKVEAGKATASVVGSTIVTSDNISLSVANSKLTASQIECTVTLSTDFCLAARGTDAADTNKTLDIYFFKDAARSRVFENAENFKKANVAGSLTSATMTINLVAGKPTPVVVVVAPNGSGFMISLPQGTSDDAEAFTKNLTLS